MKRSKLIDDLISSVANYNNPVSDVLAGVNYMVVNGRNCGISKRYGISDKQGYVTRKIGNLMGTEAVELAEYAQSCDPVEENICTYYYPQISCYLLRLYNVRLIS